jgi:hypothetical protein
MGIFGFFLFLCVVTVAANWRSVQVAQLQRDMLAQLLQSGQQIDADTLTALLRPAPRRIPAARWQIAALLVLATGSLWLSWAFWEAGTLPLVVAAVIALVVAGSAWNHERRLTKLVPTNVGG